MLEDFTKKVENVPKYEVYFELSYASSDRSLQNDSDMSLHSGRSCLDRIHYENIFPDYHDPFTTFHPFLSSQLLLPVIKNIEEQNISILNGNFVVDQALPEPSLPLTVNMSSFPYSQ